jgi:hypothetical protein
VNNFHSGVAAVRPKEDRVVKTVLSILGCFIVMVMVAGLASAQTFTPINPPPCDFSDQFYADNGLVSTSTGELNTEPDGRFGTFRQFGPPSTSSTQANWVADSTHCSATNPDERDFRILATTGGNSDDNNSPFTCAVFNDSPACAGQPSIPETLEFISILAFIHSQNAFESSYSRTVGAINGGLDGVQQNDGTKISITPGTDPVGDVTGLNPRGISMEQIVSNFEAYAHIKQQISPGVFALNPCAADMQSTLAATTPCFSVADTKDSSGNTISDVATPKLALNWRFATNRNAMDGSDNNCINNTDQNCKHATFSDSPYGYFCDDLLGMWIITYFWFTQPPNTTNATCSTVFKNVGAKNGFDSEGYPVILTAHELNDELEANGCGAEGQENTAGTDGGAAWLVCPALPDPRNGAIASDAFLDAIHKSDGTFFDTFMQQNFSCLQSTGKFCFETSVE